MPILICFADILQRLHKVWSLWGQSYLVWSRRGPARTKKMIRKSNVPTWHVSTGLLLSRAGSVFPKLWVRIHMKQSSTCTLLLHKDVNMPWVHFKSGILIPSQGILGEKQHHQNGSDPINMNLNECSRRVVPNLRYIYPPSGVLSRAFMGTWKRIE